CRATPWNGCRSHGGGTFWSARPRRKQRSSSAFRAASQRSQRKAKPLIVRSSWWQLGFGITTSWRLWTLQEEFEMALLARGDVLAYLNDDGEIPGALRWAEFHGLEHAWHQETLTFTVRLIGGSETIEFERYLVRGTFEDYRVM